MAGIERGETMSDIRLETCVSCGNEFDPKLDGCLPVCENCIADWRSRILSPRISGIVARGEIAHWDASIWRGINCGNDSMEISTQGFTVPPVPSGYSVRCPDSIKLRKNNKKKTRR